jgi:hypothetical protein
MLKRVLLVIFLAGLFSAAWGQDFGLDVGCCSDPITGLAPIALDTTGGGAHDYYNDTANRITELAFQTNIGAGQLELQDTTLAAFLATFDCMSKQYFKFCTTSYDDTTGLLTFDFNGVNPDGDDSGNPLDPELNIGATIEDEGIPTLAPGCLATPDAAGCTIKGHFFLSLNTDVSSSQTGVGTWNKYLQPGQDFSLVELNNVAIPEPAAYEWAGLGLLLVAGFRARRFRQR